MSRRQFLMKSGLAVAGAAVVVTGCGDGDIGGSRIAGPAPSGTIALKVSTVPALATLGQLATLPTDDRIAIKRTGTSTFVAISTICTHEGTIVGITGNSFECPNHGARYDNEGNVTRQPQAAGSASKLPRYSATYNSTTDILTIVT
ncbi:MAG: Rieske 2Fe-2S domain-containing protein [Gemmatimonadaceae bacterium]